jgi:hypothetical protein
MAMTVTLAALAAGCGDKSRSTGSDDPGAWRRSTDPVTTTGLAWAAGSTVHLSDGTTIDTGGFVRAFVVAGDGVFFLPAESQEDAGAGGIAEDELRFAAPGSPVTGTGMVVSARYLGASDDGRYLAAIDATSGEKDRFGTPQASVVAFDLQSGEQVVDSTLGLGDPDVDDFADAYSESEMSIVAVTDTELYADLMGDYVFDLGTGEGKESAGGPPRQGGDQLTSPDGEWRIEKPEDGPDRIVGPDGQEVPVTAPGPRWNLGWWADDQTAVGTHITGPNTGKRTEPGDSVALMTCEVPSGTCEVFEETAGQTVVFPVGSTLGDGVILQDEAGS